MTKQQRVLLELTAFALAMGFIMFIMAGYGWS